jgi:hypothetical protein
LSSAGCCIVLQREACATLYKACMMADCSMHNGVNHVWQQSFRMPQQARQKEPERLLFRGYHHLQEQPPSDSHACKLAHRASNNLCSPTTQQTSPKQQSQTQTTLLCDKSARAARTCTSRSTVGIPDTSGGRGPESRPSRSSPVTSSAPAASSCCCSCAWLPPPLLLLLPWLPLV